MTLIPVTTKLSPEEKTRLCEKAEAELRTVSAEIRLAVQRSLTDARTEKEVAAQK